MADDNLLIADPSRIQAGGGATDQVADLTDGAAEQFADNTAFDPADPPWGNDSYGKQYVQNYVPVHNLLRDGIRSLAQAMRSAATLTVDSGKSFEKNQHDNTDAVDNVPGVHGHRV
ncbi:hypothetical protein [Streptomyces sp. NPDC003247]|uniref:hypothetical protein n=1 Tax=Streptomyces sp. NPDC003247 TaxID=3364677 RepID=UPI0036D12546